MYLNCHTYYSLKYGTLSVNQLLELAQKYGVSKLVLSDINNTSAVLDFVRLSPKYGIKPVVGIDFRNGVQPQFIGIAKNNEGFAALNTYLSEHSTSGSSIIPDYYPQSDDCFIVLPYPVFLQRMQQDEKATKALFKSKANFYIGVRPSELNHFRFSAFKNWHQRMVILQPVTFLNKTSFNTHRLLRAIDNNTLLSKLPLSEQTTADEVMMTPIDLLTIYYDYPTIVYNTQKLLEQCDIDFEFGTNKNKKSFTGSIKKDYHLLMSLCYDGLKYRYPNADDVIIDRMEKEIKLINELHFSSYFLINHDIVSYAQRKNYFYVGRGSGANSMVAYLLRITDVDPIDLDLYFERFLNPFRTSPPDFDLDFSWKDRDDVTRHIFETHGEAHTCLLATYSTFQANAVMRELGKVFGLPKDEIDMLLENRRLKNTPDHITKLIYAYSNQIHDFPNHLSIHAGGILISEKPIHYYTANNYPPKGFPTSQFSMLEAEDVGLYKFDILSQRGLGHIKDAVEIVKINKGVHIDIHDVKRFKEDPEIKTLLREARCIGCFYVESPAMRMLLKKLGAETYRALVAASSIIRPGVASSGMMREYILRFKGQAASYETPAPIYKILEETFGVMVYQEDVIKVAHYYAGLGLGEADMLRRGMSGKYRGRAEFEKVRNLFFDNCKAKGYREEESKEVWRQIESFAGYAFSKGHSASYAVESFMSLYLKAYFPLEHMVAVINNFGGFYRTEFYVHEARMQGAEIIAPHINKSNYLTCIEGVKIYLGFIHISEFEQHTAENILLERNKNGAFINLTDFMKRVAISLDQLRLLIRVGAFEFTGRTKKQLLWDIHSIMGDDKKTHTEKELFEPEYKNYEMPELYHNERDDALDEMQLLGFPLCSPFSFIKNMPDTPMKAKDLAQHVGKNISIVGYLVTVKYTRTKHKDEMLFGTFIDTEGRFFDTTHFPKIAKDFPLRGKGCYLIHGRVASEFNFCSIDVARLEKLFIE
ncbi:MAG TPA: DNA polymerase III subunit alpha [Bacteroidia bacterium]|nr:DNA polymerase III subunit alpha [Bacteroidia bacterium]